MTEVSRNRPTAKQQVVEFELTKIRRDGLGLQIDTLDPSLQHGDVLVARE